MAALMNPISLGMRPALLSRLPRTVNVSPLLRRVKALPSSLPFCLFCAHTVSGAVVLADRRILQSAERNKFTEIMSEIEATKRELKSELEKTIERIASRMEGISASLQRMESEMELCTVVERFWCMETGPEGGMKYPVRS